MPFPDGDDAPRGAQALLAEWAEAVASFAPVAVAVLASSGPPVPRREVLACHPAGARLAADSLARSSAYGACWRGSLSPLAAWRNIEEAAMQGEEAWLAAWRHRGARALVRTEFPMPLGHAFECFVFCARPLSGRAEAAQLAWSAWSLWPRLREDVLERRHGISPREREVLRLLARGLTARGAAEQLGCTERTVGFHLTNLMLKLGVENRVALMTRACSVGLV